MNRVYDSYLDDYWDEEDEYEPFLEDEYPHDRSQERLEDRYNVNITEHTGENLFAVDFECDLEAPVWRVLDEISNFFEDRELYEADIYQMYTEIDEKIDTRTVTVIYTV